MSKRVEVVRPPEAEIPHVEVLRKRDTKLIKKALGKSASESLRARSVKESVQQQPSHEALELQKNQLETVQKSLGKIATEKGITKVFKRRRARTLARNLKHAEHQLG